MNFKGHVTGGTISGGVLVAAVYYTNQNIPIESGIFDVVKNIGNQLPYFEQALKGGFLFIITLFMSLFPDLDTHSTPQKWYIRFSLGFLLFLYLMKQIDWFIIYALMFPLPMIHKHRGWTHWKLTPWIISFLLIFLFEYNLAPGKFIRSSSLGEIFDQILRNKFIFAAIIVGHYTHLALDGRFGKLLYFFSFDANHH